MIRSLYTSVSGLISLENKQAVISNNMANANTNGFKSEELSFKSFKDVMIQNKDKIIGGQNVQNKLGKLSLGVAMDNVNTVFTQGHFKETSTAGDFLYMEEDFLLYKEVVKDCLLEMVTLGLIMMGF